MTKKKKSAIKLSSDDLLELQLRQQTLRSAQFTFLMTEEAYLVWLKNVRAKYNVPTPKFEINPTTGVITPKPEME